MPITKICPVCGSEFKVSPSKDFLIRCSSKCYHDSTKGKPPHNKGKGAGRTVIPKGYVKINDPLHHRAVKGWVREHIVIMEAVLGWPVELPATVHHINGDRADNRPENLEYFEDHSDHLRQHFKPGAPVAVRPKKVRHPKACVICGKEFVHKRPRVSTCSPSCKGKLVTSKAWTTRRSKAS